jgi:hypothetical protein
MDDRDWSYEFVRKILQCSGQPSQDVTPFEDLKIDLESRLYYSLAPRNSPASMVLASTYSIGGGGGTTEGDPFVGAGLGDQPY